MNIEAARNKAFGWGEGMKGQWGPGGTGITEGNSSDMWRDELNSTEKMCVGVRRHSRACPDE